MATKEELLQELDVENRYSHLDTGRLLTDKEPSDEQLKQAKDELKAWSPGTKHEQDVINMMDELYPDSDDNTDKPNISDDNPDVPPTETNTYTITWKNDDGSVLKTTTVQEGEIPSYGEENPIKPDYYFLRWEPEVVPATQDTFYVASWGLTPDDNTDTNTDTDDNTDTNTDTDDNTDTNTDTDD